MIFYFTMTQRQHPDGPGYVEIEADSWGEARAKMHREYGSKWAFQYSNYSDMHLNDRRIIRRIP